MAELEDEPRKWYVTTKGARHSYARVVHTQECSYVPRATNAHIWTRNPLDEPDTSGLYSCKRCKPQASPETITRQKAKLRNDLDDHTAQQAAHKERCERIQEVADYLSTLFLVSVSGDTATLEHGGYKFQIREVEGK
jgi:hypothetical protein